MAACEVLTQTSVPVGGLVVGPFAGVGPVPLACWRTGRHYLGIALGRLAAEKRPDTELDGIRRTIERSLRLRQLVRAAPAAVFDVVSHLRRELARSRPGVDHRPQVAMLRGLLTSLEAAENVK